MAVVRAGAADDAAGQAEALVRAWPAANDNHRAAALRRGMGSSPRSKPEVMSANAAPRLLVQPVLEEVPNSGCRPKLSEVSSRADASRTTSATLRVGEDTGLAEGTEEFLDQDDSAKGLVTKRESPSMTFPDTCRRLVLNYSGGLRSVLRPGEHIHHQA